MSPDSDPQIPIVFDDGGPITVRRIKLTPGCVLVIDEEADQEAVTVRNPGKQTMSYTPHIVLYLDESSYSWVARDLHVPLLLSQGATRSVALQNLVDVIQAEHATTNNFTPVKDAFEVWWNTQERLVMTVPNLLGMILVDPDRLEIVLRSRTSETDMYEIVDLGSVK